MLCHGDVGPLALEPGQEVPQGHFVRHPPVIIKKGVALREANFEGAGKLRDDAGLDDPFVEHDLLVSVDQRVTGHHQPQGGGLDPANRKGRAVFNCKVPGVIDTHDKIRHLPGPGGVPQGAHGPVIHHILVGFLDYSGGEVVGGKAHDLPLVFEVVQYLINEKLTLIVRVAGVDDHIGFFQKAADEIDLFHFVLIRLNIPRIEVDGQSG